MLRLAGQVDRLLTQTNVWRRWDGKKHLQHVDQYVAVRIFPYISYLGIMVVDQTWLPEKKNRTQASILIHTNIESTHLSLQTTPVDCLLQGVVLSVILTHN